MITCKLISSLRRILLWTQNALFDQLIHLWPLLKLLLQTIRPHVFLQLLLLTLQCRRCGRIGKDVAFIFVVSIVRVSFLVERNALTANKLLLLGAALEALLQAVGRLLSL